jgi:ferritin-like metal-binding protein YciE
MATIKTMHEAFVHELGDAYDAEQQLTKALPDLIKMAQHPRVKEGLQQHLRDTEQQIKNLDAAFQAIGAKAPKVTCKGMAGIIAENKAMLKEIKQEELTDGAIVGGGGKIEHYEIATYRGLVMKARLMGHQQAAQLLQQNLQMEERFAQQLEGLDQQLGQQLVSRGAQFVGHEVMTGQSGMSSEH